jgi:hypothetical protein
MSFTIININFLQQNTIMREFWTGESTCRCQETAVSRCAVTVLVQVVAVWVCRTVG